MGHRALDVAVDGDVAGKPRRRARSCLELGGQLVQALDTAGGEGDGGALASEASGSAARCPTRRLMKTTASATASLHAISGRAGGSSGQAWASPPRPGAVRHHRKLVAALGILDRLLRRRHDHRGGWTDEGAVWTPAVTSIEPASRRDHQ